MSKATKKEVFYADYMRRDKAFGVGQKNPPYASQLVTFFQQCAVDNAAQDTANNWHHPE